MDDIKKYIGNINLTVSEAMRLIDDNRDGIIFIVDSNQRLAGCLTDGDIRRFLLSGGLMDALATDAMNSSPKTAHSEAEAKALYDRRNFVIIPIVDDDNIIIGLYTGEGQKIAKRASLNVPVVINAGGKGTRLDPFTRVLPKPLIPVGELPIIEHIMREYQSYNCNEFHIIVNYKKELVKSYFTECDNNYEIIWHNEIKPLGTGGGLSLLKGVFTDTFFFANCDALLTANYESMIRFHKEKKNVITMVCAYKNINLPYGVVEIGIDGAIKKMKEKPLLSFLTNTGIYIVEPEVVNDITEGVPIDFPDIIEMERKKGKRVAVFPVGESDWMDMGQLNELEKMRIRLYGE